MPETAIPDWAQESTSQVPDWAQPATPDWAKEDPQSVVVGLRQSQLGEMVKRSAGTPRISPWGDVPGQPQTELTQALYQELPATIGKGLETAGKVLYEGGVNAIANTIAEFQPPSAGESAATLSTEKAIREYPAPVQAGIKGVAGVTESLPKMAIYAADPGLGILAFGTTPEGFDPKQAAIAAVLPVIGKYTGAITEAIAAKLGVPNETALLAFNKIGGATGAASLIAADEWARIRRLPQEEQSQAIIDAAGNVGAMFLLGTMGEAKRSGLVEATENLRSGDIAKLAPNTAAVLRSSLPPRPSIETLPELQRTAELVDQALAESQQKIVIPGRTAAIDLLKAQGIEITPATIKLAERNIAPGETFPGMSVEGVQVQPKALRSASDILVERDRAQRERNQNASSQQIATSPDRGVRTRSEVGQLPEGNVEAADARLRSNEGAITSTTQTEAALQEAQAQVQRNDVAPGNEVASVVSPPENRVKTGETEGGDAGKVAHVETTQPAITEHASRIRALDDGSLVDADGNTIKPGEGIKLSFMGGPSDMPTPWTLVKAENYPSTVNYKLNPRVTVRAANGVERTYDTANVYSPRKIAATPPATSAGVETKQPWQMTKREYISTKVAESKADRLKYPTGRILGGVDKATAARMHQMEVASAVEEGKPVPPEVLADYPTLPQSSTQSPRSGTAAGDKPTTPSVVGEQKPPPSPVKEPSVTITKNDAQEIIHKLSILEDETDLQADYGLTQSQASELVKSVPPNGGEWSIPQWAKKAVSGELADHARVLRDIANDARGENKFGQALAIEKQAKKFEQLSKGELKPKPGGGLSTRTAEEQARSKENNSLKAMAEANGVPFVEGDTPESLMAKINAKAASEKAPTTQQSPEETPLAYPDRKFSRERSIDRDEFVKKNIPSDQWENTDTVGPPGEIVWEVKRGIDTWGKSFENPISSAVFTTKDGRVVALDPKNPDLIRVLNPSDPRITWNKSLVEKYGIKLAAPKPPPSPAVAGEKELPKLTWGTTIPHDGTGRYTDLRGKVAVGDYVVGMRYVKEGNYNQQEFGRVKKVLKNALDIERPDGTVTRISSSLSRYEKPQELADAKKVFEAMRKPTPPPSEPPSGVDKAIKSIEDLQKKIRGSGSNLGMNVPVALLDTALEVARLTLKAGKSITEAIDAAIEHIRKNASFEVKKSFDEAETRRLMLNALSGEAKPPIRVEGEELNTRKSAARAVNSDQFPESVRQQIAASPESEYKIQPQKDVREVVGGMSDAELAAVPRDSNIFVASQLQLSKRLFDQGKYDEGYEVFQALSKVGTDFGQNINQFKMLKGVTPFDIVKVVNLGLKKSGRDPLTKPQEEKLATLSNESINRGEAVNRAKNDWMKDPTDLNAKLADDAVEAAHQADLELQRMVSRFTPKSWPRMLKAMVQGNPLTPISQVSNIVGNTVGAVMEAGSRNYGAFLNMIRTMLTGRERTLTVSPLLGPEAATTAFGRTLKQSAEIMRRGSGQSVKGETRQNLQPLVSLKNLLAKNPDIPTVGGKVPFNERARMAVEGVFGIAPEVMLRMLSAADRPSYEAARARLINEQLKLAKMPGTVRSMALKYPEMFFTPEVMKRIEAESADAVFQRKSKSVSALEKLIKDHGGDWADLAFTILISPYRLTPWNLIGRTLLYNPLVSLYQIAKYTKAGNTRLADLNAGRFVVGTLLYGAGYFLYKNGLIGPSLDSRDETQKERLLAGQILPPNHVNISGLNRLARGGNPKFQPGDETVDMTRGGGAAGAILSSVANIGRDMEKKPEGNHDLIATLLQNSTLEQASFTINQSFLKGVTSLLDAIRDRNFDSYVRGVESMMMNVASPNTLTTLSRATRKYAPDMKGDTALKDLENLARDRFGVFGADDYLPLKRDLWGQPIKQTPEDRNALLYHLFDISKNQQVTSDPVALELYDLWRKTASREVVPSLPTRQITIKDKTHPLTQELYSDYAEQVGKRRREIIERVVTNPKYQNLNDENKIKILSRVWDAGMEQGKMKFLQQHPIATLPEPKQHKAGFKP